MTYVRFSPRRPIKSFQDLEVYQKLLAVCVAVVKRISIHNAPVPKSPEIESASLPKAPPPIGGADVADVITKLHQTALSLPVLIASAHSVRFSNQSEAIAKLEEAMLTCNLAVVYLEQYRDLARHEIEPEFFEEQIKTLLTCRFKVMHLQMSWKKFMKEKNGKV